MPRAAAADEAAAKRPNVLVILCDDLRWDALGCAGNPYVRTPHIDRVAGEGVYFPNAFCTTSLCSPSRASILSGLYAHAHGVVDNFTEYPTGLPSFPHSLQQAGYNTAYIGKWHMGENNDEKRPGFDYFVTHRGQGKYFDTEFNVDGERKVVPGYYTHVVTKMAEDWIKRPRQQPWMLMLGHKAPHSFYFPEPKYAHAFDAVDIRYPASAFHLQDKPDWIRQRLYTWHGIYGPLFEWRKKFPDDRPEAVKDFAAMTRAYWGTILSVDDSVGQLYSLLEQSGQLDNTLIVFMGDNGLLNGEDGMVDKRTMHEPSIRIPLLVRYPGLAKPKQPGRVPQMILTEDIAPSILELCGAQPLPNIHGRSWVQLVRSGDPAWRKAFFYEYNYEKQFPYTPNVRGVRTEQWKYIHYPHGDGGPDRHMAELYDLAHDPQELHNLINAPAEAPRIEELKSELARLMRATGIVHDKMPIDAGIKQELPDQKIR
ncbi:MAG TPA: sulfatase [Pirellulales bacterium]|jgi:N-acetylglucosamine-6-sulfatase|nr:sulfatase [Pirellulales bacterium]